MKKKKIIAITLSTIIAVNTFPLAVFAGENLSNINSNYEARNIGLDKASFAEDFDSIAKMLDLTEEEKEMVYSSVMSDDYTDDKQGYSDDRDGGRYVTKKVVGFIIEKLCKLVTSPTKVLGLVDKLTGFEEDVKVGISEWLVSNFGWDYKYAYGTITTILALIDFVW